jgi:hypothetical protein
MYQRRRTLFEHQEVACETLGFHWLSEAQRRAMVRVLRAELTRTSDRQRLLQFARRWLYEHRLIVLRDRDLRTMTIKAIREHEAGLARGLVEEVDPLLLARWRAAVTQSHESGAAAQTWLWAAPAKHSSRQIEEVLERIEWLTALGVDRHVTDLPDAIVRRYARRLAARAPAVAARIAEPARAIEVACFLRYCGGNKITGCRCVIRSKIRRENRLLHRTEESIKSRHYEAVPQDFAGKKGSPYRHFWHGNQGEGL